MVDQVLTNRQVFMLLEVHVTMQAWLIILSYLLTASGNPLTDLDLFTGDFLANNDESLFQYSDIETEPLSASLAWDLDDTSLPQEGALLADALDDANACASESTESVISLRARGAECAIDEFEGARKPLRMPSRKNKFNPNAIPVLLSPLRPVDLTTSLEEFTCNNQGFLYAVCDSGNPGDNVKMFIGQYFSLSHCDLGMFFTESLLCVRSGHAALKPEPCCRDNEGTLLTIYRSKRTWRHLRRPTRALVLRAIHAAGA